MGLKIACTNPRNDAHALRMRRKRFLKLSNFSRLCASLRASKMAFSLIFFLAFLAAFRAIHTSFLLHGVVRRLPAGVSISINGNIASPGTFALNLLELIFCDDSGLHVVADASISLPIVYSGVSTSSGSQAGILSG
jgi:hypothetical protein